MYWIIKPSRMKTVIKSDQELLNAYIAGQHSSINQLIERHRQKVYNYILMMVRDAQTADDIFQDTFIKVIRSLDRGKYSENGKFISWILRIAHNQVIDHFRSGKNITHVTSDDVGYDIMNNQKFLEPNVEDRMISEQTADDIRALVEMLPIEQREVVILRHYMDMSFKEIADQTGVSINTALGRMRYALINMRKLIESKNITIV